MYTIKEMPMTERPRERFVKHGPSSLSNSELIAILIRTGCEGKSALEVARNVVDDMTDLSDLGDKTLVELSSIEGIGPAKAITILAALELGKRVLSHVPEKVRITTPKDVYSLLKDDLSPLKQEHLFVLFLDLKSRMIARKEIFVGGLNQSLVHPREVYRYAVKYASYQIVLVHNHPSGDPTPSREDIEVTKRFVEIGEMLQIRTVDHVIIGKNGYCSVMDYMKRK